MQVKLSLTECHAKIAAQLNDLKVMCDELCDLIAHVSDKDVRDEPNNTLGEIVDVLGIATPAAA
jgi:hypothetical protein